MSTLFDDVNEPAQPDEPTGPARDADPVAEAAKPTSGWPGWTAADYAAVNITGTSAQQCCRRNWLPPTVAGLLRSNTDLTWQQIETLARCVPMGLLHLMAQHRWPIGGELSVLMFLNKYQTSGTESWVRHGGGPVDACWTLAGMGVQVNTVQRWGIAVGVTEPATALADIIEARFAGFGLPREQADQWLSLAARSTRPREHRMSPVTPLNLANDLFLGGRSGLYAAAGISVTEALENEEYGKTPSLEHLESLVTLAALRGHTTPDPAWWAER